MKVDIYFNLHKKCLSIRHKGRVIDHARSVEMNSVSFVVSQKGRERVLREKRKNVHAFVRGEMNSYVALKNSPVANLQPHNDNGRQVKYNPYKYSSFVLALTEEPIYRADSVLIQDRMILVQNT